MKLCDDRWREELVDHVLGSPASAALTAHLGRCAACTEVLREWSAQMGQIDAGIRQLAASEPAAHSASRLMAEVRSRRRPAWLPGWRRPAATLSGLVILVVSFLYLWRVHEQRKEAEKELRAAAAIGSWRSPTESLLRPSTDGWLKATPQLGKYFYQLQTNVPEKERAIP